MRLRNSVWHPSIGQLVSLTESHAQFVLKRRRQLGRTIRKTEKAGRVVLPFWCLVSCFALIAASCRYVGL